MTKRFLFVILFIISSFSVAFAQSDALKNDLGKSFKNVSVARLNKSDAIRQAKANRTISIAAANKNFELSLTPRDMRSSRYFAEEETADGRRRVASPDVTTYKGKVVGDDGSEVRLTIDDSKIEGYFGSNKERFFIESARKYSKLAAPDEFVVYQAEDVLKNKTIDCPQDLTKEIADGKEMVLSNGTEKAVAGAKVIEMATDADLEYLASAGGTAGANSKILSILNMVEGFYEPQFNLSISVVYQHSWATADNFLTATPIVRAGRNCNAGLPASRVLCNFQDWWEANRPTSQIPRDSAHFFTYKASLQGAGYAWVGAICNNPSYAYSLSGRVDVSWNWEIMDVMVASHELGHNLGAVHPQEVLPAPPPNCNGFLMDNQLGGSTQFALCGYSDTQIRNFLSSNDVCLAPQAGAGGWLDFDGDGKTDVGIYRPSTGEWWLNRSSTGQTSASQFGNSADKVASGDYTGDGKTDIAIWRPSNGFWYILRSEDNSFFSFPFGTTGDVPAPADYDGDNKTDAAIFRPSTGTWYILKTTGGTAIWQFGQSGDVPVTSDYDGDGKSDVAIYRPSAGEWWISKSTGGTFAFQFGLSTDKPVQGDYTGDGKSDVAIYRPSNGNWYVLRSENNSFYSVPFGASGDLPAPGDYDGDGKFDTAVFRPAAATWYINRSTQGIAIYTFGASSDLPIPAAFVP